MLRFSKKRFFITLGLSIFIWLISNIVQLLNVEDWERNFSLLGTSCTITGYPVSRCIDQTQKIEILSIYLLNIFIWFWIIHLFWNFFQKRTFPGKR
ncbi:MAG: hypothetical protein C4584_01680 [Armatimonadetes bacterium]|nr:MAG: hypothetical protein C4584_01680 [Armatimonadota bacterium]